MSLGSITTMRVALVSGVSRDGRISMEDEGLGPEGPRTGVPCGSRLSKREVEALGILL